MPKKPQKPILPQETVTQATGLIGLLILGVIALFGPGGMMAWSENSRRLELRRQEMAQLVEQRDALRNRVALLDPQNADPDLVGELLRRDLNVAHPDEIVVTRR